MAERPTPAHIRFHHEPPSWTPDMSQMPIAKQWGYASVDHPEVETVTDKLSKTYTPRMLLEEVKHTNFLVGRTYCPFTDWLEAHVDDINMRQFESMLFHHPVWAIPVALIFINTAHQHNNQQDGAEIQKYYTKMLLNSPFGSWDLLRVPLQEFLKEPVPGGIDPTAYQMMVDYIAAPGHHKNPKNFFYQPDVHRNIPAGMDLSDLPTSDEDVASRILRGPPVKVQSGSQVQ